MIIVGASAGLFFVVFLSRPSDQTTGIFFLIFAAICYAAAEVAVSQASLYRYGIEEALAVCSVGFLCAGMQFALFSGRPYSPRPDVAQFLVPAAGAVFSLWIWRRFGLWYAFLAAMIFAIFLPGYWTSSRAAQHVDHRGVLCNRASGGSRGTLPPSLRLSRRDYSLVEAFLWLGIYLAINLSFRR